VTSRASKVPISPDREIIQYLESAHIHQPATAAVTLNSGSIDEIRALLEAIDESLDRARTDFADAVDQPRSSDAIGHAIQVQGLGALRTKLELSWRDHRGKYPSVQQTGEE
jgi:hypothetical protein